MRDRFPTVFELFSHKRHLVGVIASGFTGMCGSVALEYGTWFKQYKDDKINCEAGNYENQFAHSYDCNSTFANCYNVVLTCANPANLTALVDTATQSARDQITNFNFNTDGKVLGVSTGFMCAGILVGALLYTLGGVIVYKCRSSQAEPSERNYQQLQNQPSALRANSQFPPKRKTQGVQFENLTDGETQRTAPGLTLSSDDTTS